MALNLDQIKDKLNKLQSKNNQSQYIWKPKPGETQIRILPYQHNKENPFIELYFHYNVGKKNYLSLTTFGEADPITEFSEKLMGTGDKDDWKFGRRIYPTMRTFVPVLVRGKEEEGVKFWGFGKTIYTELLKIIADPDYGDITDLKSGRDITVERKTPQQAGNTYGSTSVRVKPNQSPATTDKEIANKIMNEQPNMFDIYQKPTYETLKTHLEQWMEESEDDSNKQSQQSEDDSNKQSQQSEQSNDTSGNEFPLDESNNSSDKQESSNDLEESSNDTKQEDSSENNDSNSENDLTKQFEDLF